MLDIENGIDPWVILPLTIVIVVTAVEAGYRVGRRQHGRLRHDGQCVASGLTMPAVSLVGLMLAFTFGWAATRFDVRRTTRVDEAQALGRVFYLADALPAAGCDSVRALVRDYIRTSIEMRDAASVQRAFRRRTALNQKLWTIASTAGRTNPSSLIVASFVASVNDIADLDLPFEGGVRVGTAAFEKLDRELDASP